MFFELFKCYVLVAIRALPRLASAVVLVLHQLVPADRKLAIQALLGTSHAEICMLIHQGFLAFEVLTVLTFHLYFC